MATETTMETLCGDDQDVEVVALSPESLTAENKFLCGVCGRGFQRDQNLQLHRRSHKLPWELKNRDGDAAAPRKKRVYVCPEADCPHHHRSRAIGDLSGIKKHYSRKHGEKKFKCDGCAKPYAVASDLRVHMKNCGSQVCCHCGHIFSKRENIERHQEYCKSLEHGAANHPSPPLSTRSRPATTAIIGGVQFSGQTQTVTSPVGVMRSRQPSSSYVYPSRLFGHASSPFQYMAAASPPLLSPDLSATAVLQRATQVGSTITYSSSSGGDGSGGSYIRGLAGRSLNAENEAIIVPPSGFQEYPQMDQSSPAMIFGGNCPSTLDFLGLESGGYGNASTSRRW